MSIQNRGFERQMENEQWLWTANEKYDSTGCRNEATALNAKLEKRLWTPK